MESFCFAFLLFDYEITYGDRLTMPVMQNTKEKFEPTKDIARIKFSLPLVNITDLFYAITASLGAFNLYISDYAFDKHKSERVFQMLQR